MRYYRRTITLACLLILILSTSAYARFSSENFHSISFDNFSLIYNEKESEMPEQFEGSEDDHFIISEGVLKKYTGNSKNVVILEGIIAIGEQAFQNNKTVEHIIIPHGVESIGKDAFSSCTNLKTVEIPETVTSIGSGAFYYCPLLKSVNIPKNVTKLENRLFQLCESLTRIILPEKLESIGTSTFHGCTSLKEIFIPESVEEIASNAFGGCENLTIICGKDSYAEQYAKDEEINFITATVNIQ